MRGLLTTFSLLLLLLFTTHSAKATLATLTSTSPQKQLSLKLTKPGWAILNLKARLAQGGWGTPNEESAVLALSLGKTFHSHVVVMDKEPMTYKVLLSNGKPGPLTLTFTLDTALSRNKGAVILESAALETNTDPAKNRFYASSPVLTISTSRLSTDYPAFMGYAQEKELKYTVYFTNEDGGTGRFPTMLMGIYARLADIESALWTVNGVLTYQSPGHLDKAFSGPKRWGRPALSVCTDNGLFCPDDGAHPVVLSYVPIPLPPGVRERAMDVMPWFTRIVNEEVLREKDGQGKPKAKADTAVKDAAVGDARQYLYADFTCTGGDSSSAAVEVKLKTDPRTFKNDWAQGSFANPGNFRPTCGGGEYRVVVKLPWGVKKADIAQVGLANRGKAPLNGAFVRAFLLDGNFAPADLSVQTKPFTVVPGSTAFSSL